MGLWDRFMHAIALNPIVMEEAALQERAIDSFTDHPGLTEQLAAIQGLSPRPWRVAGMKEALGVPAIFRAVSLISSTVGMLSLKALRNGTEVPDADRPRIIVRPNPFTTPRDFLRDTAYSMATRGEAWWWVAARDSDGLALSLIPVNAGEVTVSENEDDLRFPIISWRGRRMRNEDMRQITFMREPGNLRGYGPLQMCGAAISVAVESEHWAANHFAAPNPSILIKSAIEIDKTEADQLKEQWIGDGDGNMPKVIDPGIEEVTELGGNSNSSQMLDARFRNDIEAAQMFGIPGSLLEAMSKGSSLTYQNLEGEFTKFLRACLLPYYLEPIEQEMSDLLSRTTVARFNTEALLRADIKTRFEVYTLGVQAGILTPEMAQQKEGIIAGDIENAPMPLSLPQAVPPSLPIQDRSRPQEIRCDGMRVLRGRLTTCGKLLSTTGNRPDFCPRCKKVFVAA